MSIRCMIALIAGGVILIIASSCARNHPAPSPPPRARAPMATPGWTATAPGIDVRVVNGISANSPCRIVSVRLDLTRCRLRALHANPGAGARAATVCPQEGVAINAAFFDEQLAPIGLLVIDGTRINPRNTRGGLSTFLVSERHARIVGPDGPLPEKIVQAVQCKPRLVVDGIVQRFKPQPATARSAVGLDARGRVYLTATNDPLPLEEWATFLHDDLECVQALNLDGGPSAQLAVRGAVTADVAGATAVPVFLTAAPR